MNFLAVQLWLFIMPIMSTCEYGETCIHTHIKSVVCKLLPRPKHVAAQYLAAEERKVLPSLKSGNIQKDTYRVGTD